MTWRERQAAPGPRRRFFFASVVPCFVDAETGAKIEGLPAPDQKWKLVWPRKGAGLTYRKYEDRHVERQFRPASLEEFSVVDHPVAA